MSMTRPAIYARPYPPEVVGVFEEQCALAGGLLRTSTRARWDHDLTLGRMLIWTRGLGSSIQRVEEETDASFDIEMGNEKVDEFYVHVMSSRVYERVLCAVAPPLQALLRCSMRPLCSIMCSAAVA